MCLESIIIQSMAAFFVTLAVIIVAAPLAYRLDLTDKPSSQKRHQGEIPLVGGISIFLGISFVLAFCWAANETSVTVNGSNALWIFVSCGAFLVVAGMADDRFHLGVSLRVCSEVLVAVALIEILDYRIVYLGDLLGMGNIKMSPLFAYPFTVIAIVGIINAFNMLDGIDGLLALLVVITLVLFHLMTGTQAGFISSAVSGSLLAFLISNLNLSTIIPKTFLGDAGSKLLGFIVVCLILAAASRQVSDIKLIAPVTALFLVGVPLCDLGFIVLSRLIRKRSPLIGDRSHIHHLMKALGFSDHRTLAIILCIHSIMAVIGLLLHRASIPENWQFYAFLSCFVIYCIFSSKLWRVARRMRSISGPHEQL